MRENMPYWAEVRGLGQGGSAAPPSRARKVPSRGTKAMRLEVDVQRDFRKVTVAMRPAGREATSSRACTDVVRLDVRDHIVRVV